MEAKFLSAWAAARQAAAQLGVRQRRLEGQEAMAQAHRCLSGHRESDGFAQLAQLGRLELSLEALAVKKPYTALFSDQQVNTALQRLLESGYRFR